MTNKSVLSSLLLWNRRILGGLWALCGLACLIDLRQGYWWEQPWQAFLLCLVGLLFVFGGIRFVLAHRWAGRAMVGLMFVAGLFFLDMVLLGGWASNRQLLWVSVAGLGLSGYTMLITVLSAIRSW
jgi:hypothetical protein